MIKLKDILKESNEETIEKDLKAITGQPVSVSIREPGPEYRIKWSYMKKELPDSKWNAVIKYIEEKLKGVIDKKRSDNYYEANWEREEPAESVPIIYFVPNKSNQ